MRRFVLLAAAALLRAAPAAAQVDCEDWGASHFFSPASAAEVRRCLEAGADANARFDPRGDAHACGSLLDP